MASDVEAGVDLALSDGRRVLVRPIRATDAEPLRAFDEGLCERSRCFRYLGSVPPLTEHAARKLATVDGDGRLALVAIDGAPGSSRLVGDCRLLPAGRPRCAEIAIAVADDFQDAGLGTAMVRLALELSAGTGIEEIVATVGDRNRTMIRVLSKLGFQRTGWERQVIGFGRRLPAIDDPVTVPTG